MKTLIAVSLVIAVALGAYALTGSKKSQAPQSNNVQTQTPSVTDDVQGLGSLKSLLALNRNLTCTFEHRDEQGQVSGTTYISGVKLRGDFELAITGTEKTDSHMIRTDGLLYVWSKDQGTKFENLDFEDTPESLETGNQPSQTAVDLNDEIQYTCQPWAVDNAKFQPPSNVSFTDFSSVMTEFISPDINIDCSACDQVPAGEAREQCRVALRC